MKIVRSPFRTIANEAQASLRAWREHADALYGWSLEGYTPRLGPVLWPPRNAAADTREWYTELEAVDE